MRLLGPEVVVAAEFVERLAQLRDDAAGGFEFLRLHRDGGRGAQVSADTVLVTGLAGLVVGAGSMAMGEWVSVTSARELAGHQLEIEAREIEEMPDEEREELALIHEAKVLDAEQARELAARQVADRSTALDTLACEDLGGSAAVAAGTSFVLFAIGAMGP